MIFFFLLKCSVGVFLFCFELELELEFPLSVSNISSLSVTVLYLLNLCCYCVIINLLKSFTECFILDVWWKPKFASDSIRICFFEFIDDT